MLDQIPIYWLKDPLTLNHIINDFFFCSHDRLIICDFCFHIRYDLLASFQKMFHILHQGRRMYDIYRIPVWREFCLGIKQVYIFAFSLKKYQVSCPLNCLSLVKLDITMGIISALGEKAEGTSNSSPISLLPCHPLTEVRMS